MHTLPIHGHFLRGKVLVGTDTGDGSMTDSGYPKSYALALAVPTSSAPRQHHAITLAPPRKRVLTCKTRGVIAGQVPGVAARHGAVVRPRRLLWREGGRLRQRLVVLRPRLHVRLKKGGQHLD